MKLHTTLALAIAGAIVIASSVPAEAKRKPHKPRVATPAERVQENPDSYDCIRARGLDPAGNYRGYPCWARAALSGRQNR